jgi:hypothetical protein
MIRLVLIRLLASNQVLPPAPANRSLVLPRHLNRAFLLPRLNDLEFRSCRRKRSLPRLRSTRTVSNSSSNFRTSLRRHLRHPTSSTPGALSLARLLSPAISLPPARTTARRRRRAWQVRGSLPTRPRSRNHYPLLLLRDPCPLPAPRASCHRIRRHCSQRRGRGRLRARGSAVSCHTQRCHINTTTVTLLRRARRLRSGRHPHPTHN